jgi:hypothetical protein
MRYNAVWDCAILISPGTSRIAFVANAQSFAYSGEKAIDPITTPEAYCNDSRWRRSGVKWCMSQKHSRTTDQPCEKNKS